MAGTTAAASALRAVQALQSLPGLPGLPDWQAEVTVRGVQVGLARPVLLVVLPVAVAALAALVFRRKGPATWGRRRRVLLFGARLVVVACLVLAAAGPYTVQTRETAGDPQVRMLVDESTSMAATDVNATALARDIEAEGVPVSTSVIAAGNASRVGDGVAANLAENGSVLVVSDGQVTGGRSLDEAADVAASANATVNALDVDVEGPERAVTLSGPGKTSVGVENSYVVRVSGTNLGGSSAVVTVRVDGTPVFSEPLAGEDAAEFTHTFEETGPHRITATVETDDHFAANDVFHRSVRVVERPRVLYVSQGPYPLRGLLDGLYNLTTAERVPDDLSGYRAVVVQDTPAGAVGNVSALQRHVINGNGLVVVGGPNAYERGGYQNSSLGAMTPVQVGEASGRRARIVLAVDISGSTESERSVQKALSLTALDQLGDDNAVGLVAFARDAYRVADLQGLGENRGSLEERIRRLESRRGTDVAGGLRGAADLLGQGGGNVILITDGQDDAEQVLAAARTLDRRGVSVVVVGVGDRVNDELLREVASETGGTYFRADETDRLRLLFGGESRQFEGSKLTVVDRSHFVTAGVEPESNPATANDVSVKEGADYLVATGDGTPAVATWRYGLGRVVSITAYGSDGTLDGLLQRPDSLLVSRSVNWVIGDPERGAAGVVTVSDTRVGQRTVVRYAGDERPTDADVRFRQVGERVYETTVTPREAGFGTVLDAEYAVNYPEEYAAVGQSPALRRAVRRTGGQRFAADEPAAIAEAVTRQSRHVREVRDEWAWLALLAGLAVFLVEVGTRRIQLYWRPNRRQSDT